MRLFQAAAIASITTAASGQGVLHVNHAATGANDGSSWEDAFVDLHDALAAAGMGTEIWIAQGTYQPGKSASFHLASGAAMYGGFAGNETKLDERDWKNNETILRREGLGPPILIGKSLPVGSGIDGFIIRDGLVPKGGDRSADGGALWLADSMLQLTNCLFIENGADNVGGAIYVEHSDIAIENCDFVANASTWFGGAIYADSSVISISHSLFESNGAQLGGGVIRAANSTLMMEECKLMSNWSVLSATGGAVHAIESDVVLRHCALTENVGGDGGGIYSKDTSMLVEQCMFTDNGALSGAAIGWAGGPLTIRESVFERNSGDAHAVRAENVSDHLFIERSVFRENHGGVGISNSQLTVTIIDSEFVENATEFTLSGGGVRIGSGAESVEVDNCLFEDNAAVNTGGGISISSASAIIRNTRIVNNTAQGSAGGGISSGGNLTLINCEITGNDCYPFFANNAGGISHSGGSLTMINTLVADNFPSGVSLGTSNAVATGLIINSTIANNPILLLNQHAGLRVHPDSHATVRNSIVWGNGIAAGSCEASCGSFGGGCWCDETCCNFQDCCLDFAEHCDLCDPGDLSAVVEAQQIRGPADVMHTIVQGLTPGSVFDIPIANNIGHDPLFVDPANGDFRLQLHSPAIDAGNNTFVPEGITTDLDGNPRIVAGAMNTGETPMSPAIVDMGAYEFQPEIIELLGDLNGDGIVNHKDIVFLVQSFGPCPSEPAKCPADLNGDGVVNAQDLLILLGETTPGGPGGAPDHAGPAS